MKTMSCKQLGGGCDKTFKAGTFEEIAEMSKKHGMEMVQKGDKAHLKAMNKIIEQLKSPDQMRAWFSKKKIEFDHLPDMD